MGSWSGYWDVANNIFGAQGKSKWQVFNLRVGSTPIVQNFYLYEYPYLSNASPCNCISYRDKNIRVLAEMNYKQAYQLDPNFGASIQCGECQNTQATQRNVKRHEVLYSANLALMYGAKFIGLWNYFAQAPINSVTNLSTHGIVDWYDIHHTIYTDKYYMLRDTLSPRLKGLFGQKIKNLIPNFDLDSLGILVTFSNENVNYIKNISLISAPQDSTPLFDLGFFSDPASPDPTGYEDRYFMLLKRYYPQSLGLQNFNVSFNNMSPYTNWQISDFIDTAYYTITPYENGEFV
jgi:bacterioferritin-associated ferredoxin